MVDKRLEEAHIAYLRQEGRWKEADALQEQLNEIERKQSKAVEAQWYS